MPTLGQSVVPQCRFLMIDLTVYGSGPGVTHQKLFLLET